MENIAEKLRQIRLDSGLSQAEFAKKIGVSQRSWSAYESGETRPKTPTLLALSSMGYDIPVSAGSSKYAGLAGAASGTFQKESEKGTSETVAEDKKEAKVDLGNDLRKFRKEHDWTQKQISEKLGIPLTTWASWENGQSQPKLDMIIVLRRMGLEIPGLTSNETPVSQAAADYKLKEISAKRIANTSAAITMLENAAKSIEAVSRTIEAAVTLLKENIGE